MDAGKFQSSSFVICAMVDIYNVETNDNPLLVSKHEVFSWSFEDLSRAVANDDFYNKNHIGIFIYLFLF